MTITITIAISVTITIAINIIPFNIAFTLTLTDPDAPYSCPRTLAWYISFKAASQSPNTSRCCGGCSSSVELKGLLLRRWAGIPPEMLQLDLFTSLSSQESQSKLTAGQSRLDNSLHSSPLLKGLPKSNQNTIPDKSSPHTYDAIYSQNPSFPFFVASGSKGLALRRAAMQLCKSHHRSTPEASQAVMAAPKAVAPGHRAWWSRDVLRLLRDFL